MRFEPLSTRRIQRTGLDRPIPPQCPGIVSILVKRLLCARRMRALSTTEKLACCAEWPTRFGPRQWPVYSRALTLAQSRGIRLAVGGGLAMMAYTGRGRNSKDLDIFILRDDREEMIQLLLDSGLEDYYPKQPYDRSWIFRTCSEDVIVDVIWEMANHRASVDAVWVEGGPEVAVDGLRFRLVPPEELLWAKLYVFQRDRCDWPDALNLLYAVGPDLDWEHLLERTSGDAPLLGSLLSAFGWISPDRARELPSWLWRELQARPPEDDYSFDLAARRASLLDTRPWFTPTLNREAESC